ncbi:hypothetical protein AAL_02476 [Moelleriella libera RCEF 2490]|uniref:Uncharacterized protein n=1 Tax=Moelleriella libera RCEF 2490 TaxID=1081109 RepID=A0A168ELJ6_9HYPO|nr:hypothetical protein AAL_02476 [Moelleriella libera RCEF 2490]
MSVQVKESTLVLIACYQRAHRIRDPGGWFVESNGEESVGDENPRQEQPDQPPTSAVSGSTSSGSANPAIRSVLGAIGHLLPDHQQSEVASLAMANFSLRVLALPDSYATSDRSSTNACEALGLDFLSSEISQA